MSCNGLTNTENTAGLAGAGSAGATRRESRCLPLAGHWPDYEVTALLKRCPGAKVRSPSYNQHTGGAFVPVMFQSQMREYPRGQFGGKLGMNWPEFPPDKAAKPLTWRAAEPLEKKFSSLREAAGLPGTDTRQSCPFANGKKQGLGRFLHCKNVACPCFFRRARVHNNTRNHSQGVKRQS